MLTLPIKQFELHGFTTEYLDVDKPNAPVLLFLHSIKNSKELFQDVFPAFTQHFRVIAIDIRGHGNSSKMGPYTFHQIVDDIRHLLDHENIDQVSIIAASFSCVPAQMFAVSYPERVHKLVLLDGGFFNLADVPGFDLKKEVAKYEMKQIEEGLCDNKLPIEAYESYFSEYSSLEEEKVFPLIQCSVLLLLADEKMMSNKEQQQFFIAAARNYEKSVKNVRTVKIPNSFHLLVVSNPEETVEHALAFLT